MSDLKIAEMGRAQTLQRWVQQGPARHQEAIRHSRARIKQECDRLVGKALLKCPYIVAELVDIVNNSDKRLLIALSGGFLSQQLHGTPSLANLDPVINPLSIQPVLAETLPINRIKAFPEDNI
jgi:hypothetical protein